MIELRVGTGCCSLAPVLMADNDTYGRPTRKQVPTLLKKLAGAGR